MVDRCFRWRAGSLGWMLASFGLILTGCCCPCGDDCGMQGCGESCCGPCDRFMQVPESPPPTMPPPPRRPPRLAPLSPPTPTAVPQPVPTVVTPDPLRPELPRPELPRPEPLPPGDGENLGIAAYPPTASLFDATMYGWRARTLVPMDYRMGYALDGSEQASVRDAHHAYARKVRHETTDGEVFRWMPPPGCVGSLACVFEELVKKNRESVKPIAERFRLRSSAAGLDAMQVAALVVTWVQAIRYEVPLKEPFGVLPPALVAAESWGDCDSKALLALMILHDLGIDGLLVSSSIHRHTMLGIPLPASGSHFTHAGRRYAFTECTAVGAPIGYMDPKLKQPNDWSAVIVRM